MSEQVALQRRFMANWLVLSLNVLLLAFLVLTWLMRVRPSPAAVRRDERTLGMDVYCERAPFAVFVNKDFAQNKRFTFLRYDFPMFLANEDMTEPPQVPPDGAHGENGRAPEKVLLGIGEHFLVSCVVSSTGKCARVEEFRVSRDDADGIESFLDLNADGFPDARLTHDWRQDVHRSEIWYGGKWEEVIAQGKWCEKQLPGGEKVQFNRQTGLWVLAGEESKRAGGTGGRRP